MNKNDMFFGDYIDTTKEWKVSEEYIKTYSKLQLNKILLNEEGVKLFKEKT